MSLNQPKLIWLTAMLAVSFTAIGCRSGMGSKSLQELSTGVSCSGGTCQSSVSTDRETQSPAEYFAQMNYESYAAKHADESRKEAAARRVPNGPDSLFATMR